MYAYVGVCVCVDWNIAIDDPICALIVARVKNAIFSSQGKDFGTERARS